VSVIIENLGVRLLICRKLGNEHSQSWFLADDQQERGNICVGAKVPEGNDSAA
jgi:hypothetical protein